MNYPHKNIKQLIFSFENHDAVYFRVPKVASTSLLIGFRKIDNVEKVEEYDSNKFKFAFVRNPFDRLASCYRHVIQKGSLQNIQDNPNFYREMSFNDFVDAILKIQVSDMDIHFRPQYTFIPETPDFLGKFENIEEDFKIICEKIGIQCELLHQNKTDKIDFKKYYIKPIAEKVLKIYKKDFELFNYQKFYKA